MADPALLQDVNLAICGHAWHGKSTLIGKTLVELKKISPRKLEQYERDARAGRDASFVFAIMVFRQKDPTNKQSEAARGVSMLPSYVRFEFPTHRVTVIDTPGQEEYANNRIAGMFSADCAVLAVDVVDQVQVVTEQTIRALRGYAIPLAGVLITKMDKVDYREEAYLEAVELTKLALTTYEMPDDVPFIPTSAYSGKRALQEPGEGLTCFSERLSWYTGPTFHGLMGMLKPERLRSGGPLRVCIHSADIYEDVPGVGTAFTGLVESGRLERDQKLVFEPASAELHEPITAEVRSVELTKGHIATPGVPLQAGRPRQLVGVALRNISEKHLRELCKGRGSVAGTEDDPPRVATWFEADVTVFDKEVAIKVGQQFTLHAHVDKVAVTVLKITPEAPRRVPGRRPLLNSTDDEAPPQDDDAGEQDPVAAGHAEGRADTAGGAGGAGAGGASSAGAATAAAPTEGTLRLGGWARLTFEALRPIAIEEARRIGALSRLVLRVTNRPIGFGQCIRILEERPKDAPPLREPT